MLYISVILLAALIAVQISKKSGIPSLMLFLSLGIISSLIGYKFEDYQFAENFSQVALLIIIFYGGFGTNWKAGRTVVKESLILSTLGVIFTSLLTGTLIHFILGFGWIESFLIGSIIGSTDYTSVSNILSSKNLNLKYNTASLLEFESGSNDPIAFTLTCIFLALIKGEQISIGTMLFFQIFWGILIGVIVAYVVRKFMEYTELQKSGFITVFFTAVVLLSFSISELLNGNGFLTVYILGLILGNQVFIAKKEVMYFFDGVSNIMDILLFFILGLLATPSQILANLFFAIVIAVVLIFVVRPLVVFGLMLPFNLKLNQMLLVSWGGLRGAAAIAFAIMVVNQYKSSSVDIFHIIFGVCLISSLIQGSSMKWVTEKLQMIDPRNEVLRTFNYYVGKGNITFVKSVVDEGGILANRQIKDISLDKHLIIAKVIRDEKSLVPKGSLVLKPNDIIIWIGEEYFDPNGKDLIEFTVTKHHAWNHKYIRDLNLPDNELIVSINRNDEIIPATGSTLIETDDRVLLFKVES